LGIIKEGMDLEPTLPRNERRADSLRGNPKSKRVRQNQLDRKRYEQSSKDWIGPKGKKKGIREPITVLLQQKNSTLILREKQGNMGVRGRSHQRTLPTDRKNF